MSENTHNCSWFQRCPKLEDNFDTVAIKQHLEFDIYMLYDNRIYDTARTT